MSSQLLLKSLLHFMTGTRQLQRFEAQEPGNGEKALQYNHGKDIQRNQAQSISDEQ